MKTNHKRTIDVQNPNSALLSRQLVAKKLGVSSMTVKRYQNKCLLNPIYLSSRAVCYKSYDTEILNFYGFCLYCLSERLTNKLG